MEEIKKILNNLEGVDPIILKRLEHLLLLDEAAEVEYQTYEDSFGRIYTATCPSCGEVLKFERYSQTAMAYSHCYRCGKKLHKKEQNT